MFGYLQYQLIEALLMREETGIATVDSECISVCSPQEAVMAVTPFMQQKLEPKTLALKDVPVLSLSDGKRVEGMRNPQTESELHRLLYNRYPQMKAIVHVQSEEVIAYSQKGATLPVLSRTHAENFLTPIKCTESYLTNEDREPLTSLLDTEPASEEGCVFLKGDGALVWAEDLKTAIVKAEKLEAICKYAKESPNSTESIPEEICRNYYEEAKAKRDYFKELHPVSGNLVTDEENKIICLDMLRYLDQVCRENGIHYSITGGTLLGAIRHRGFIPWDDDIDTFLTRPEYEKLIRVFPKDGPYKLYNRQEEKGYVYVWSRLIDTRTMIAKSPNSAAFGKGLFLDVCVVDGLPHSALRRKIHMKHIRILFRLRRCCIQQPNTKRYNEKGFLFVLMKRIVNIVSDMEHWNRRLEKVMQKFPFDKSEYVGNFVSSGYGKREQLHRSVFDEYSDIEFEGVRTMVCKGYEEYLHNIYGDYMSLPDYESRKGRHPGEAYWL